MVTWRTNPNLKAHIKGSHPAVYEQMLKKKVEKQKEREARVRKLASPPACHVAGQMTIGGTIQKTKLYEKDSTRYKSITVKLDRASCEPSDSSHDQVESFSKRGQ